MKKRAKGISCYSKRHGFLLARQIKSGLCLSVSNPNGSNHQSDKTPCSHGATFHC